MYILIQTLGRCYRHALYLEGVDAGGGVGVALWITWVLDVGGVLADGAATRRGPAKTINYDAIALSMEINNFDYNYVNDIII